MSTRYGDRDYDRSQRDYGRRSDSDYERSYGERSQGRYGRDENERESFAGERGGQYDRGEYGGGSRYGGESGGRSQYGGSQYGGSQYGGSQYGGSRSGESSPWRSRGQYRGRESYRPGSESDWDYTSERESRYGSFSRGYDTGSYDDPSRYDDSWSGSSQRYNYPTGFRSHETHGERGRGGDYGRGGSARDRGWWDRASDEVASWFGDEEAERRRRMDEQRQRYRGKGPKGYRRSDERIQEDVNDRLSEGYLDASEIEVNVSNSEVTLNGTVNSRSDKRRAEDIVESVMGVTHVENRLRVQQSDMERQTSLTETGSTTKTTGSATTGATGTARSRSAGT